MRLSHFPLPAALCFALLLSACGSDEPDDVARDFLETPLAVAPDGPLLLELYTKGPLEVGRNEVAYRLVEEATGAVVATASLSQRPMMTMENHAHTCPTTNPATQADEQGLFLGVILPTMPSGDMGSWSLAVDVTLDGDASPRTFDFGTVTVSERSLRARKDLVVGDEKLVFTLNFPAGGPAVGANDVTLTAHAAMDMGMRFPPQTDLTIRMTPEMPTMGHGSTGNVDPVHTTDGDYRGLVNFNMAGAWRLTFQVARGEVVIGEIVYDFEL